jgi:urease accessory protein
MIVLDTNVLSEVMRVSLNKPLPRASSVCRADGLDRSRVIDRVVLDADERHRRRVVLTGERGTQLLLDLPHATVLHDGDGLLLDDGSIILVAGKCEALVEIAAAGASGACAARLAYRKPPHRCSGRGRAAAHPAIACWKRRCAGLARIYRCRGPFEPEPGAYGQDHGHGSHRHDG